MLYWSIQLQWIVYGIDSCLLLQHDRTLFRNDDARLFINPSIVPSWTLNTIKKQNQRQTFDWFFILDLVAVRLGYIFFFFPIQRRFQLSSRLIGKVNFPGKVFISLPSIFCCLHYTFIPRKKREERQDKMRRSLCIRQTAIRPCSKLLLLAQEQLLKTQGKEGPEGCSKYSNKLMEGISSERLRDFSLFQHQRSASSRWSVDLRHRGGPHQEKSS